MQVVEAMGAHGGAVGVQEAGCGALWNLAANNRLNQTYISEVWMA